MLISPPTIFLCTHWWLGLNRRVWPHMATRPVFFCMATTASASARLSASGISTCTCLPAFIHARACSACICVGGRDHCVDFLQSQAVSQVCGGVADAVSGGDLLRLWQLAADQRHDL